MRRLSVSQAVSHLVGYELSCGLTISIANSLFPPMLYARYLIDCKVPLQRSG